MKKQILLMSLCFATGYAKDNTTTKSEQTQTNNNIKEGDTLNLSDFTEGQHGIRYKVVTPAPKGKKPFAGEKLKVHYTGWLLKDKNKVGKKFDSSKDRNSHFSFVLQGNQVIAGWDNTLANMKIGETRIVILPADQAYGQRGTPNIPANSTLIFEIEFLGIAS